MNNFKKGLINYGLERGYIKPSSELVGKHNYFKRDVIFHEIDGDTTYSIHKGVFFIRDLKSKHLAYKVMKHIKYEKPIIEYVFKKTQAEVILKDLMKA